MAIRRINLLNHEFSRSLRGYDPTEVTDFLHDVESSLAQLSDEKVRLINRVNQLEELLKEYVERENVLRNTLVSTQKMAEDLKTTAQKEAQLIIGTAQSRAETLTSQAEMRLARILEDISEARKLKAQFEFKVRSVIEGHLKLLELGQVEDTRLEKATQNLGTATRHTKYGV